MHRHLRQLHRSYGEFHGVRVARKHIGWYLKGRRGSEEPRKRLMKAEQPEQQFDILNTYFREQHSRDQDKKLGRRLAA